MSRLIDIQDHQRSLAQEWRALEAAPISEANRQLIREFMQELALEGLSIARQLKYIGWLRRLARRTTTDFACFTAADCRTLIVSFEAERQRSPWTKNDLRIILRRFFAFVPNCPRGQYPDVVSWIKVSVARKQIKLPGDGELLTQDEINKLVDAAANLRDKAIVATLWESGCRIAEIGNLQIQHVTFDQYGAVLSVYGKTGARQVRLISSVAYLANWMACHPHHADREAPLWSILTKKRVRALSYGYFRMLLQRLALQCGIKKRVNPHMFRHSRATLLANHLTEFQMNQYLGWKQGSDMPSTYVHLSGKNIDAALLQLNGQHNRVDAVRAPESFTCARCQATNPATHNFCRQCGAALQLAAVLPTQDRGLRADPPLEFASSVPQSRPISEVYADPRGEAVTRGAGRVGTSSGSACFSSPSF